MYISLMPIFGTYTANYPCFTVNRPTSVHFDRGRCTARLTYATSGPRTTAVNGARPAYKDNTRLTECDRSGQVGKYLKIQQLTF